MIAGRQAPGLPHQASTSISLQNLAWMSLYAVLVTTLLYTGFAEFHYDDPFITYRYARNLANGLGFVYNPGEPILSTTTPLFALLLAGLSYLWSDLPHLANLLGALGLAAGGLFLWDLARSWEAPLAGWAALLLYPSFPLLASTLGSETPLYLAFCLGALASFARRSYGFAGLFAALAVLARPDGALIPALLAVAYLFEMQPRHPWRAGLLFLGICLGWALFAWQYFGSPLPVTLAAKQHQGSMAISQQFAAGFLSTAAPYAQSWHYRLAAVLAFAGLAYLLWRSRRWSLLLAWTLLYFIAYSLLGVSRYYWYYAPLVPGFIALVGLGLHWLARPVRRLVRKAGRIQFVTIQYPGRLSLAAACAVLALLLIGQAGDLWRFRHLPNPRYTVYREVGLWLNENTPPEAAFGALEVGIMGYYSDRPVIDFAGLIQPEVARQLAVDSTYTDAAVWAVERYRPEYLVLQDGLFTALEQSYLSSHCQPVQHFSKEVYAYDHNLTVYACEAR